jgi:hypothetical protein
MGRKNLMVQQHGIKRKLSENVPREERKWPGSHIAGAPMETLPQATGSALRLQILHLYQFEV